MLMFSSGNFQDSCTQCNLRDDRWFNCGCWKKAPKGRIDMEDIDKRLKRTSIDLGKIPLLFSAPE